MFADSIEIARVTERRRGELSPDMNSIKTASVCGLGKLGACIAATLAARGFEVVGVDIDQEKVRKINEGLAPLDEPLLAETIRAGQSRFRATLDARETVATDVTFFIPPSPSLPDGSFSNEFLLKAMQPVARAMKDAGKKNHLFVCSSTTTPGAIDAVLIPTLERELDGICGRDFSVCYNPEFIALGDVINGLLEPDLVLIGESDPQGGAALEHLYRKYNRNSPRIARMSIVSAELTKISLNSYITMKISFTNQLRLIAARHPQADIHAILDALGNDSRIGKKYLRAGLSYGGPCFPRDNRLLAYTARQVGLEAPLAEASDRVNERTKEELVEKIEEMTRPGDVVAVLGVAYKPNTYITEEAAGLFLAQRLKRRGNRVLVHDFAATPVNAPSLHEFEMISNWDEFKKDPGVDLVVICCPWPQYRDLAVTAGNRVFTPWQL
ncbi:UDP-glucose/GDP-mannose dehydrogenase family protein [Bradyrhizobium sp. WSM 1738]|uniref:nucleotide sugar dehydrogenase n=1 Tax=Bradyrhizobium hereditatis TaxID=2821405 RepID=UPI001CE336B5|nr:nucleotide sugar dehydrogenase [Bradyrhizobium hereditatis]MCA6114377.1 UDP-glucose/GDP-mannose dehydrogenase family protein [Bradyrhizobium hereditatis]